MWHCFELMQQELLVCNTFFISVFLSTNNFWVDLYNGDLQTTTVLFTRNFTEGWLNSYYWSSALSCPFIVQHKQCNQRSWSRKFAFSLSQELYCNFYVVYEHIAVCYYHCEYIKEFFSLWCTMSMPIERQLHYLTW